MELRRCFSRSRHTLVGSPAWQAGARNRGFSESPCDVQALFGGRDHDSEHDRGQDHVKLHGVLHCPCEAAKWFVRSLAGPTRELGDVRACTADPKCLHATGMKTILSKNCRGPSMNCNCGTPQFSALSQYHGDLPLSLGITRCQWAAAVKSLWSSEQPRTSKQFSALSVFGTVWTISQPCPGTGAPKRR